MSAAERTPGSFLLHPATLALLALWVVNDHVLKDAIGGFWTGKLSDVASLAVFPLLPTAAFEWVRERRGRRDFARDATLVFWCAATGFVMATINVFDSAAWCYRWGLGLLQLPFRSLVAGAWVEVAPVGLTMDPTDLWTLPALAIPWSLGRHRGGAEVRCHVPGTP